MTSPQELDVRIVSKWVLVHNQGTMLDSEKARYGVDVNYFIGFAYVDPEAGLTIDLLSYCTVDGDRITLTKGPQDDKSSMKLRFTHAQPVQMTATALTTEQRNSLGLPVEPKWLSAYKVQGQDEVDRLRNLSILHAFRAPGFPDDIRFLLFPVQKRGLFAKKGATQPEEVWGRLLANPQANVFIVRLLNQPHQDFDGIKMGDFLIVEVKVVPQGLIPVCVGKATPR